MGRPARAGRGSCHGTVARCPPPRWTGASPGPHVRGLPGNPPPRWRLGTGRPPACEAAHPAARPWRDAAPPYAAPSAAQRAHPGMGPGPDCLTTAPQDLGRQLTPLLAPPDLCRTSMCGGWVLPLSPPLGRGRRGCMSPTRCWAPPLAAAVRGCQAPPGPHARGASKRHIPASTMAYGRRLAGRCRADLRDPPHRGGTTSDARPGRGLGLASLLGGALGIPGGGGGIWDAPTGGAGILVRQGIPARQILPPKGGGPHRGGRPRPDPLALHPLVPRFGGPGAGRGFPARPCGVRRLGPASPQADFLEPRHAVCGTAREGPAAGGGGTSTLTSITRCGHGRPSWRRS